MSDPSQLCRVYEQYREVQFDCVVPSGQGSKVGVRVEYLSYRSDPESH